MYHPVQQQLVYQDSIPFEQLDRSDAIPITINSFSDGFNYNDFTSKIVTDPNQPPQGPTDPWDRLVSKQPLWIQELLEEVVFPEGHPNPFAIMDIFDKEGHLVTVSDGSVIFHYMSFVWVLAHPD